MKRRILGLALLVLTSSVARTASADGGSPLILLPVVVPPLLDIGLAAADLSAGAQHKWRSRVYGGFETAAGGAQLGFCVYAIEHQSSNSSPGIWELGAAVGAIFMVHGIVTLVAPREPAEPPPPPPAVTVAPLALSDVARSSVPGLAVLGRF